MKLENVKIRGLKIIKSKIYKDKRGFLGEIYKNNYRHLWKKFKIF